MLLHAVAGVALITFAHEAIGAERWENAPNLQTRMVEGLGGSVFIRSLGKGPPVLLIHGYAETGDMWEPLARSLADRYTVIVPDLPGLGQSGPSTLGYAKKRQAQSLRQALEKIGVEQISIVGHDLGGIVAHSYAARYRASVERLVFMEAPIPGVGPWNEVTALPALWHWNFGGPDMERLVAGRERIYFDHFWRFAAQPEKIDDATRAHYARQYAKSGVMRAGFAQFAAFAEDARDNLEFAEKPLDIPVLAVGGEKAFGHYPATFMRAVATNVDEIVLDDTGHWLMEEQPEQMTKIISDFLEGRRPSLKNGEPQ